MLEDYKTKTGEREEAKIKVSEQNLVEEVTDIVECGEGESVNEGDIITKHWVLHLLSLNSDP